MEKSIKGTETEKNLLKSFAGESQARSRYTFFASKAKKAVGITLKKYKSGTPAATPPKLQGCTCSLVLNTTQEQT